jgi:GLPGLI family protein
MKKLVITLTTLIFFNISFAQTLNGKVIYEATLNPQAYIDKVGKDSIMPKARKESRIKRALKAAPVNFHLLFNGTESLYKAEYDMETNRRLGLLLNQTGNVGEQEKIYYKNIKTQEMFYQSFWTQNVLVTINKLDWNLTQETKKIGSYTCYKATATINSEQLHGMNFLSPVIAWYTPQIPVPFGIQRFNGLPGLTLELIADYENGEIRYVATKIELNPEKEIKIKKPKGKKRVSEQEYIEMIKNMSRKRN